MTSSRAPYDQPAPARTARKGPHLGPVTITPARVFLVLAFIGGLAFLGYSVFFRDRLQVPLMATGLAICGIVFGTAAAMSVGAVIRAGRERRDGTAVLTALIGGLLAFGSLMFIAAAVIMGLIWSGTSAG
jgi:hypothetical protein